MFASRVRRLSPAMALTIVCSAVLIGLGQGPGAANHLSHVTAVKASSFNYYTDVSLFGGPKMRRGFGQQVCVSENNPSGCVPASEAESSSSPSVQCPPGGGTVGATDSNGARGVYGPATIFGGKWPATNDVAPPSGPLTSKANCLLGAGGHATSSTLVKLMPAGSRWFPPGSSTSEPHPGGVGPGPFIADKVTSSCTANADGTFTTAVSFVNGILETRYDPNTQEPVETEPIPASPPPNYTREGTIDHVGDRWRIVLNEQTNNPDGSRTVVAAHMYLLGPTAVGDMFVGSTTCGLTRTPVPHLVSVGDVAVAEGDAGSGSAIFTVSLSEAAGSPVTVNYATANGTAVAGSDYTAKSGSLTFPVGTTSLTVKVPVVGDTNDESNESFNLNLSGASGANIADGTGVGTVVDDEPPAATGRRLAIGDVAVHEGDGGTRTAVFTVRMSKSSTSTVTVSFATANGSATQPGDYTAKSGTLSFAPGVTSMTVKVPVNPDNATEPNETFNVNLSGASGATITDAAGLGTIVNDD